MPTPLIPYTWSSFEVAKAEYENGNYDGLGFVFTEEDDLCGIDLDKCRDPDIGEIDPGARWIIENINSYTEVSPSETGVKIFAIGELSNRKKGNIEAYSSKRFFTVTGNHLPETPKTLQERKDQLAQFASEFFPPPPEKLPRESAAVYEGTEEEVLERAKNSLKGERFKMLWAGDWEGYESQSEADLALCGHLMFLTENDEIMVDSLFRKSGLMRKKWDERRGDLTYGEKTLEKAYDHSNTRDDGNAPEPGEDPLKFPEWVMCGLASDFAELYSSYLEAPREFFFFSFLTVLGNILSDRISPASEINAQPRLYTVLLGESADERKSTAIDKTVRFFREYTTDTHFSFGVGSAEGLQRTLEEKKKVSLCLDELKQFTGKCSIQGSVLLPCVNTLFELNRYQGRTKNSDIFIEDAYLSILAASTLETYAKIWTSEHFMAIGFDNRLWLVPGSGVRKYSFPREIPESEKKYLAQELGEVLRRATITKRYTITPDAFNEYDTWYMDLPRSPYAKRIDTYAMRLMSLLAANEKKGEIDIEVVRQVMSLADWQYEVRGFYAPIDAEDKIAKMEENIRRNLEKRGPMTEAVLRHRVNIRHHGIWTFDTARENLVKSSCEVGYDRKKNLYFLK